MRFCKEQGPCARVMAEFIDDVATFRVGYHPCHVMSCYVPFSLPLCSNCDIILIAITMAFLSMRVIIVSFNF
jgi:hypothetical protein